MKETAKNQNNDLHLYGYINGVRMNEVGKEGRVAINLNIATMENFKQGDEQKTRRTFHEAVLFTSDKDLIAKFEAIKAAVDKNRENVGVEGFKPETHTISADGFLVKRENAFSGGEKYDSAQIMLIESGIDLDVKQAEKEVRNSARLSGNIASIKIDEGKDFASLVVIHHYNPKEGKENELPLSIRVNGSRRDGKQVLEDLKAGKIKVGDYVKVGGQLRTNNFETDKGMRFGIALDMTSFKMLRQKEAVKVEEAKKPEVKPAKKARSRKGQAL